MANENINVHWGRLFFAFMGIISFAGILGFFIAATIIKHQGKIEIPDVAGQNVVDALEELNQKKLNLQISERAFDSAVPRDYIISQYPASGEEVKEGRIIRVVVSRGISQTKIPNVEEMSLREAQGVIKRDGWTIGRITFVSSSHAEEGRVISQTPKADSDALPEAKINLLVSGGKGKNFFYMPDLIGKNIEEVKKLIKGLDLAIGEIKEEKASEWENGTVLEQKPQSGYMVSIGDTIDFKISVLDESEKQEKQYKSERQVFLVYSAPAGLVDRELKIVVLDETGSKNVLNRKVKPSEKVNIGISVVGDAEAKIFLDGELVEERRL